MSETIEVLGHRMFLDNQDILNLSHNGIWEKSETEAVQREIKRGDIVLDIGAHIGYYTLIMAELVGGEGKVFSFEAYPENFNILKKNVEINGYQNVTLINKAVSDITGNVTLYISNVNMADNRIYDSYDGRKYIDIDSIKLDDYFLNFSEKIDFCKIDTQGAEYKIIKGMSSILNNNKYIKMMLELWPEGLKMSGASENKLVDLLLEHNFKLYDVYQRPINDVEISKIDYYINIFCKRGTDP